MRYSSVLTIAGSDSGGGAGIQADIKTISACGSYAASAITAITVQNTIGVSSVYPLPIEVIEKQIDAVLSDIGADAIKIGMMHSSEVMHSVKRALQNHCAKNIVLDPVMVSTSGHILMQHEAIETLKRELLFEARVITPNIPEGEILLGKSIKSQSELPSFARELSSNRRVSVLLKAGHLTENRLIDIFYNAETDEVIELSSQRIDTKNTHGTGCTLSSAIAAFLAQGLSLNHSVIQAKEYVNNAIIKGKPYVVGSGHGPVHHFYGYWG